MRRNFFGEAQPIDTAEIVQAMQELDIDTNDCFADIDYLPDEEEPFTGWSAEIVSNTELDNRVTTLGFPSREELESALMGAGVKKADMVDRDVL